MSLNLEELVSNLRENIGDELESGIDNEFSDNRLKLLWIPRAVESYSQLFPHILVQSLTTVADQDYYQVSTNAIRVLSVNWRATGVPSYAVVTPYWFTEWYDNARIFIRDQMLANYNGIGLTHWQEVNNPNSFMSGLWLRVFPTPTAAGDEIKVEYAALHPLNAGGTAYDTIRADHLSYVVKLAEAAILKRRARSMLSVPDIQSGETRREAAKVAESLRYEAGALEEEVRNGLTFPVGAR